MSHLATFSQPLPERIGDFAVVGVLGEGGSGIVYDARWGHREVALKVLHPTLVATAKEREQFLSEARLLADLHHPAVVKVLGVGEAPDGRPFLAMEKLAGEPLAKRLARGPLPVAQALELFGQLADAVAALHTRGLVHRDLKPENVVLVVGADGREHVVLLDFGIAKELAAGASTTTQEGKVRGTPAYMAPERFFGQPASVATDVYELAVTLFAMLAGRLPWDDSADPEVRLDPRRLSELAPHVPAGLDLEVRRALSTRAQNRPAGASELRAAVMAAAGAQWAPRATVDVRRPRSDSQPMFQPGSPPRSPEVGSGPIALGNLVQPGAALTSSTPRRRRLGLWLGLGMIAVVGIGVAASMLAKPGAKIAGEPAAPPAPPSPEPQRESPAVVEPAPDQAAIAPAPVPIDPKALGMPSLNVTSVAMRELEQALVHLPDDATYAVGFQIGAMQRDTELRPMIELLAGSTALRLLKAEAGLAACDLDVRANATWLVAGGPATEGDLDLIVAGKWTRAELDGCLQQASGGGSVETAGRVTIIRGKKGERVVGWIDDHTAMLSSRDAADAAWMTARLDDTAPPAGELAAYLAELDRGGTMWLAGDSPGRRLGLSDNTEMVAMWGAITTDASNVSLDVRMKYPSKDAAAAAEAEFETEAQSLGLGGLGRVQIDRDATRPDVLHAEIQLARMIVGAIFQSLLEQPQTP